MSEPKRRSRRTPQTDEQKVTPVPHSMQAEQAALGAMLMQDLPQLQRDIVSTAICIVAPEHFYREPHKHIYRAIIKLYTTPEPVDVVSVAEELRRQGLLEKGGGAEYLIALIEACPSSAAIERYAHIVRDRADDRERLLALESALTLAKGEEGTLAAAQNAMKRLEEIDRLSQIAKMGAHATDVKTAAYLLNQTLPDAKMTVEGLLPVGLTVLAGPPKTGKSWMSLGFSVGVASGGHVLGRRVDRGEVLYIALEDTEKRLQGRLRHQCRGGNDGLDKLHYVTEWPRLDEGGGEKLDAWLASHPDCKLVIIDTLQKFRPAVRGSAGDFYGEDYAAVGELKRIADKRSVSMLLIHHTRKSSGMVAGGDALEEVAGTMGITGAADGILVLRRTRGGGEATLFVTGRDVNEQELAVKFDSETGTWAAIGDADEVQMSSARKLIWQTLFEFHQSGQVCASPGDIAGALGRSDTNSIRQNLHQMVKDGQIKRLDKGEYALLPEDEQKARNAHYNAQNNASKPGNNANNANAWAKDGFIKGNAQSSVSHVSAQNDEITTEESLSVATLAAENGITPEQVQAVVQDFHDTYQSLQFSPAGFRMHLQTMRREGRFPTSTPASHLEDIPP